MSLIKEAILKFKNDVRVDTMLKNFNDVRTFRYNKEGSEALSKVTKVIVNPDSSFMFIDGSSPEIEDVINQYNLEELKD
jgi:hypothetical protein